MSAMKVIFKSVILLSYRGRRIFRNKWTQKRVSRRIKAKLYGFPL